MFKLSTILSVFRAMELYSYKLSFVLDKLQAKERDVEMWENIQNKDNNEDENDQPVTPPNQTALNALVSMLLMIRTIKR